MKDNKANKTGRISFLIIAALFLVLLLAVNIPAKNSSFQAKRLTFCKTMLEHGEQAYARGDYAKAGYYFKKAVEVDAEHMSGLWFKDKNISLRDDFSTQIKAKPPVEESEPNVQQDEEEGGFQLMMGDDEGC